MTRVKVRKDMHERHYEYSDNPRYTLPERIAITALIRVLGNPEESGTVAYNMAHRNTSAQVLDAPIIATVNNPICNELPDEYLKKYPAQNEQDFFNRGASHWNHAVRLASDYVRGKTNQPKIVIKGNRGHEVVTASEATDTIAYALAWANMSSPDLEENNERFARQVFAKLLRQDLAKGNNNRADTEKEMLAALEYQIAKNPAAEPSHGNIEHARRIIAATNREIHTELGDKSL